MIRISYYGNLCINLVTFLTNEPSINDLKDPNYTSTLNWFHLIKKNLNLKS